MVQCVKMFVTKPDETISMTRLSGKDKHCSNLEMLQCSGLTRARGRERIGEAERALRSVNFSICYHRDKWHYAFVQSHTTPRGNLMVATDNDGQHGFALWNKCTALGQSERLV